MSWTFLSNHGHVLLYIAKEPEARVRDIAEQVGITERSVSNILTDLEIAGAITRFRDGRRNFYEVNRKMALRHPIEAHHSLGELIDTVGE
jgi:DNA-binding MarR family transcriptional regulator